MHGDIGALTQILDLRFGNPFEGSLLLVALDLVTEQKSSIHLIAIADCRAIGLHRLAVAGGFGDDLDIAFHHLTGRTFPAVRDLGFGQADEPEPGIDKAAKRNGQKQKGRDAGRGF